MEKITLENKNILLLAPHPDDAEIGCAGILLNYATQCTVVILTDGRHGGLAGDSEELTIAKRKSEFEKAMSYAGVANLSYLDVEDGKLSENFPKFSSFDFSAYDVIFCPAPKDNHPDHSCVVPFLEKLGVVSEVYGYEVWSAIGEPTHYLDITNVVERKKELIGFHESQVKQVDYVSRIIGLNHYRGMLVYPAIGYAEVYQKLV